MEVDIGVILLVLQLFLPLLPYTHILISLNQIFDSSGFLENQS